MSNYFKNWGLYFGYPKCCIEFFIQFMKNPVRVERKLYGTGYIPCDECNKKTKEELISVIKANRKCATPFPKAQTKTEERRKIKTQENPLWYLDR